MKCKRSNIAYIILFVATIILLLYNDKKSVNKSISISDEDSLIEINVEDISNDDLKKFYGKEVEIFLKSIKDKYLTYVFMHEPPGKINGCLFTYDNMQIYIYVNTKDQELNRIFKVSDVANWKIENFIKLKIERIEIFELAKKK